ncbi:MAG: STAS domain-containing protein [Streptosporangiaceae bacterium]
MLDLVGLSFCDAGGLSAFVQIANHADTAGCRFALFAPQPLVAKILRISGLDGRMPVLAGVEAYEQHAGQHETRRPMFEPTSR